MVTHLLNGIVNSNIDNTNTEVINTSQRPRHNWKMCTWSKGINPVEDPIQRI